MNKSKFLLQCLLAAAGTLLFQATPVLAQEGPPPMIMAGHMVAFDWVRHTQSTLDELKGLLNLTPDQTAAWDTWSHGVIKDAHQQIDQRKLGSEEKSGKVKDTMSNTTPELMAQGIEHLRAQTAWMQAHLTQLEAAQVRTLTFYNTLSANQKTIFDLFWHEMHHRSAGHDGERGMRERMDANPMFDQQEGSSRKH